MRDFILRKQNSPLFHLAIILIFALSATAPIFFNGVPVGNDLRQHYQFAWTIHETLAAGEIYPSLSGAATCCLLFLKER